MSIRDVHELKRSTWILYLTHVTYTAVILKCLSFILTVLKRPLSFIYLHNKKTKLLDVFINNKLYGK